MDGAPVGILSERDVLRLGAAAPESLATTLVADAMTKEVVVGVADDLVEYAAGIMTANRIRHLPIVDGGRLIGSGVDRGCGKRYEAGEGSREPVPARLHPGLGALTGNGKGAAS